MTQRLIGEDIDLAWFPDKNLWLVKIDPAQVEQILASLSINARDAIGGAGKVTIETTNVYLDDAYCAKHTGFIPGEYVQLAVSDNGCGVAKEDIANIFEPFFTTKNQGKGKGMGLSTIYGIIKQNNGFIDVYSELETGTCFRIYLPRYKSKNEKESTENQDRERKGNQETILLVEDEPALLKICRSMLEKLGYCVITANSPSEAIALAEKETKKIDLLITDLNIPEMNGQDLCKQLMSLCPNLKCLLMSGYTDNTSNHDDVLQENMCFMQKPFSRQILSKKIREALQQKIK